MLWPDPNQRARLVDIRDNLLDRIAEAEREGWFGEVEGLRVSLAGAQAKLTQIDHRPGRWSIWVSLAWAPARLTRSPSTSPNQPSRSASAMRSRRLSRMSTRRARWFGSGQSMEQRTQAYPN